MENSNTEESVSQSVPPSTVNTQPWWCAVGYGSSRSVLPSVSVQVSLRQNQNEANGYDGKQSTEDRGESKGMQDTAAEAGSNESSEQDQPLQPTNGQAPQTAEYYVPPTQLELRPSVACAPYPYTDPYYGGMMAAAYGTQPLAHPQFIGMPQNRLALPLEMTEEPVYVNAKQYHGILRRRQSRAKAELEKKFVKVRKPYLHESRHKHAMRRARGCGGRFLNTKKSDGDTTNTSAEKDKSSVAGGSVQSGSSYSEDMNSGVRVLEKQGPTKGRQGNFLAHDVETRKRASQNGGFQQTGFPFDEREDGDCSGQQRNGMLAKGCRTVTIQ